MLSRIEFGRTMQEIIAVLAVIGILSITGVFMYARNLQEKEVNSLLNQLSLTTIEINSAMVHRTFATQEEFDAFLDPFTVQVGNYTLKFHAENGEDALKNKNFVSEILNAQGGRIKGRMCRAIINKMAEQSFVSDVDFTLKDEEQEDGSIKDVNIQLNKKVVDMEALCGG